MKLLWKAEDFPRDGYIVNYEKLRQGKTAINMIEVANGMLVFKSSIANYRGDFDVKVQTCDATQNVTMMFIFYLTISKY
jgi:hypothetical protein